MWNFHLHHTKLENWIKYKKQLISDGGQQEMHWIVSPERRKTNEVSPMMTLAFCLESPASPKHIKYTGTAFWIN